VLEYEIAKYDGDLGNPNLFVPLPAAICEAEGGAAVGAVPQLARPPLVHPDTFWASLRLRGIESNSPSGFTEAFTAARRRATLGVPGIEPQ
jgi:hypothetical protein